MARHRIVVKKVDGEWVLSRENWPVQSCPSRAHALERARLLAARLGDAEVTVVDVRRRVFGRERARKPVMRHSVD